MCSPLCLCPSPHKPEPGGSHWQAEFGVPIKTARIVLYKYIHTYTKQHCHLEPLRMFSQVWISVVKSICSAALWTLWGLLKILLQLLKYLPSRAAAGAVVCSPQSNHLTPPWERWSLNTAWLSNSFLTKLQMKERGRDPWKKGELTVLCTEAGRINSSSLRLPHRRRMSCQALCMENKESKLMLMEYSHNVWMCPRVNILAAQEERW